MNERPVLRLMEESDLQVADELRRIAGWNQTPDDWRHLLELEPRGCFVAGVGQRIVGAVTTTRHGPTLAWVGMLLVHPDWRNQGIGTLLLHAAVDCLERGGMRNILLDATPAGRPLYEKSGFVEEWTLTRYQRPVAGTASLLRVAAGQTREMRAEDWAAVDAIDAMAFGTSRARLIQGFSRRSRRAVVWPARGSIAGWGLLRPGAISDYLGPVVCADSAGGIAMVDALIGTADNRAVTWDIPDQNVAAQAAAAHRGFTPTRPLIRMRRGTASFVSHAARQFAIADPSVG